MSKTKDANTNGSQRLLDDDFKAVVEVTMERWKIPGMAIAVVDGGNTWAEGYGYAQLPDTPVTPDTLFYAGSTTKAFTAATLAMLVEDDESYPQVQWGTPVNQLIRDDFVLSNEWDTDNITVEDILSHRTGMPRHEFAYGGDYDGHPATLQDIVRSLRYLPRSAPPRTTFQYCNVMFIVASHLIESLTGDWLGNVFRQRIWDPLGMNMSFLSLQDAQDSGAELAQGYCYNDDADNPGFQKVPWKNKPEVSGAGAIISNVNDYAKWAATSLRQNSRFYSPAGYSSIFTPRTLVPYQKPWSKPSAYALAWYTDVYNGVEIVWHDGGIDGFGAEIALIPSLDFAVITMANTTYSSNYAGTALVYHLIDNKLGLPSTKRFDWNAYYEDLEAQMEAALDNALETFYPSIPSPARPPSLPLALYIGHYCHPAYRRLSILWDEEKGVLHASRPDSTTPCTLTFSPVSGDFFLVTVQIVGAKTVLPAEFRLGPDGTPSMVGIAWEPTLGDEKIWMVKEDERGSRRKKYLAGMPRGVIDPLHPIDF
ncbi:putative penicillin-binding protein [Aspergillus steynii IBT 23096]|uniref:Putative penicillin-binding protein n=1 Tax=Aspergillus steynii IBT 23096 TaxID=1392250 RepID=A0A2I2G2S5_9EURO|nr:putative penicillin-binding protein [Aspergillus steynii IBT 23096]PLB47175.1 putative penicillin-binding protein [Aspergillus steynii IBT 23096]